MCLEINESTSCTTSLSSLSCWARWQHELVTPHFTRSPSFKLLWTERKTSCLLAPHTRHTFNNTFPLSVTLCRSGDKTSTRNFKPWSNFKQADTIMCCCRCLCQKNFMKRLTGFNILFSLNKLSYEIKNEMKCVSVETLLLYVGELSLCIITC